ncbi:MAG: hypothetical protein ACE5D0_01310 [Fidelibacterota bacterium]
MKYLFRILPVFCTLMVAVFLFNACDDNNTDDIPDELQKGEGLIPAVIGNRWIYSDSLWIADSLWHANFDTVEIIDTLMRGDQIWWQTKSYIPDLYNDDPYHNPNQDAGEFYIRNDSIFGVTYNWGNRETVLRFIPPPDTSTSYYVWYEDTGWIRTAVMQPESITVPAGTFDSCGVYTDITIESDIIHVIAPGVGVLQRSVIGSSLRWIITLIGYELVLD